MPLQTACTSCSTKIKVKDELLGKLVKCPKCGEKFKASNSTNDSTAVAPAPPADPKPAAKKPPAPVWSDKEDDGEPAPWDAGRKKTDSKAKPKKKEADVDAEEAAFDKLLDATTASEGTKKLVQDELGIREKGVWVGQPCPTMMTVRALGKVLVTCFTIAIISFMLGAVSGVVSEIWWVGVGGGLVLWLLLAPILSIVILFMDRRAALGTVYVVTNKRCIVFNGRWFTSPKAESYYPDLLVHMRRMRSWFFGSEAGDLVFRSVTTVTTTHHARGGTSTSYSTTYYGFLGIRNLEDAERIIRSTLLRDDDDDEEDDDDDRPRKKKKKRRKDDEDDN